MHHTSAAFLVTCWTFWFIGQYISVLSKAYAVVTSKLNAITTYNQFFALFLVPILARTFASVLAMMFWEHNPMLLSSTATFWMPDTWKAFVSPNALGLSPVTAGLIGLMFDGLLDRASPMLSKIPGLAWMQPYIPAATIITKQ